MTHHRKIRLEAKTMRICKFVEGPFKPSAEGATLCFLNFCRALSKREHDVIVVHCYRGWSDPKELAAEPFYTVLLPESVFYNQPHVWLRIMQLISPDAMVFDDAERILTHGKAARALTGASLAWEVHDIPTELSAQLGEGDSASIQQWFTLAAGEADIIWCFTNVDAQAFNLIRTKRVSPSVIPPFIDLKVDPTRIEPNNHNMIFIGNNYFEPNLRALFELHRYLIPAIEKTNLGVLNVYGTTPSDVVNALQGSHMVFHGYISDLSHAMIKNALAVVPVRFASGIRIKTLSFLAYGIPVLSTEIAKTGIDCSSIFVEDDVTQFGKRAMEILTDRNALVASAENGRKWLESNFDENMLALKLEQLFSSARKDEPEEFQSAYEIARNVPPLMPRWLRENIQKRRFSKTIAPTLSGDRWAIAGKGTYMEIISNDEETWLAAMKILHS